MIKTRQIAEAEAEAEAEEDGRATKGKRRKEIPEDENGDENEGIGGDKV